jgi:hypothetical protein
MSPSGGTRSKRLFSRPLAEYVNREIDPLVARQGFGESSLILRWPEIAGARTAAMCEPVRLQWPPRARQRAPEKSQEPATLVLRVEPGFGLDIQHMSPAIIERVNAHLGWRCVARVVLRQEPLRGAPPKTRPSPPSDPAARARAATATEGVADDALRAALITLGERALASTPRKSDG